MCGAQGAKCAQSGIVYAILESTDTMIRYVALSLVAVILAALAALDNLTDR